MSQVVLADEINRATPKTQSSLLECMEERQATIDGITHPMPDPFLVIATQNPIEYEGTFALPEAQLDRFMLRIRLGYPALLDEIVILDEQKRTHPIDDLARRVLRRRAARAAGQRPRDLRRPGRQRLHRPPGRRHADPPRRLPRRRARAARIALYRAAQALAGLLGRDYVIPDDVKALAGARAGPPRDHQDELVDPRRRRGARRPRAAGDHPDRGRRAPAGGPREVRPSPAG